MLGHIFRDFREQLCEAAVPNFSVFVKSVAFCMLSYGYLATIL